MTKHIDADKLKAYYAWWGEDSSERTLFDAIIDVQPAADVVEVRRGRWANGAFGYGHYWCTVCQKEVWSEEEKTNFCPHCGAKMDGGGQ